MASRNGISNNECIVNPLLYSTLRRDFPLILSKRTTRRSFLKLSLKSIIALSAFSWMPGTSAASSADALFIRQIVTGDSRTSRTIMWESMEENPAQYVEYHLKGSLYTMTAHASYGPFEDDSTLLFTHIASMEHLKAATVYEYRITDGTHATEWYPLRTDNGSAFKMLIFPDSQCSDGYITYRDLAQGAWQRNPDASIFVNMGDLVDNGEQYAQWRDWFNALGGIKEQIIFAPLMGNHATYNLQWKLRLPVAWLNYFAVPENNVPGWGRYFYSFDYGDVHFIMLNNLMEELDPLKPGLLDVEIPWLKKDFASSNKKWKIVMMHKDIINDPYDDFSTPGRIFMPLFDELRPDVVFDAHQHTYRRLGRFKNFRRDDSGPLYIDTGVAGNVRYDVPINKDFDEAYLPQPEIDNYLVLEASSSKLDIKCFQPDGSLADHTFLVK